MIQLALYGFEKKSAFLGQDIVTTHSVSFITNIHLGRVNDSNVKL